MKTKIEREKEKEENKVTPFNEMDKEIFDILTT